MDLGGGNGVSNLYYLQAGLLRAAKTTNVTITDSDTGEVYLNSDGLNVRKAMYNSSSAAVRPGYVGEIFPPLTGSHLIPNNTRMTYTAAAYVDGFDVQDNLKNTYSFNFTSDGEMPYIVDRENLQFRTGDDGRKYLDVTLADNFCLAGATLYSTQWKTNVNNGKKEMSIGSNYYDGIIPALKADGTSPRAYEEYTYTFDVTDFYQKLLQGTFYVVAYDYAMNQCAYRVTLPENAVTKITLDQTAVTLPQKGYVQLNATMTPDDATDQNLVWSSSDSSVAEVKNGIVAAKSRHRHHHRQVLRLDRRGGPVPGHRHRRGGRGRAYERVPAEHLLRDHAGRHHLYQCPAVWLRALLCHRPEPGVDLLRRVRGHR